MFDNPRPFGWQPAPAKPPGRCRGFVLMLLLALVSGGLAMHSVFAGGAPPMRLVATASRLRQIEIIRVGDVNDIYVRDAGFHARHTPRLIASIAFR